MSEYITVRSIAIDLFRKDPNHQDDVVLTDKEITRTMLVDGGYWEEAEETYDKLVCMFHDQDKKMKFYAYQHYCNCFYFGICENPSQLFFDAGFWSFGWSK